MTKSKLRERAQGRLFFGESQEDRWSISDPASEKLADAMHAMRYGTPTFGQTHAVLAAAEAYCHLCCYPLRTVARRQFDDICRALRSGMPVAEERKG